MIAFELLKYGSFSEAFSHLSPSFSSVLDAINLKLFYSLLTYFLIAFFSFAVIFYKSFMDEKNRLAQAEAQLTLSRLNVLKSQLHPHFLFNTLNAISELVHSDQQKADLMIARLSELLRIPLENENVQKVKLKREIEFLERYLDIQKIRFSEKLEVSWNIAPDSLEAEVPFLILQPIVENAVQHGISKKSNGGILKLSSRVEDSFLILEVADSGPGFKGSRQSDLSEGWGLSNTRERLSHLYGSNYKFVMEDKTDGGTIVIIEIPFKLRSDLESDIEFS
jgi:sensor histidine kinase YesM